MESCPPIARKWRNADDSVCGRTTIELYEPGDRKLNRLIDTPMSTGAPLLPAARSSHVNRGRAGCMEKHPSDAV
jgi:hypothetical protein